MMSKRRAEIVSFLAITLMRCDPLWPTMDGPSGSESPGSAVGRSPGAASWWVGFACWVGSARCAALEGTRCRVSRLVIEPLR